jgi:FkbM family methyltransferase
METAWFRPTNVCYNRGMKLSLTGERTLGEYLRHTFIKSIFRKHPVILDLGGNRGEFAGEMIARYGATMHVYEPLPELFESIAANANLQKFEEAIVAKAGPVTLVKPDDRCATIHEGAPEGDAFTVKGVTFKTALDRVGGEVDLVKMDIEGAEIDLLEQIPASDMRRIRQMTVEFHDFLYPELTPRVEAIKRRIDSMGFYVIPFSRTNGDVLFVRRDLISEARRFFYGYPIKLLRGIGRMWESFTGHPHP